MEKTPINTHNIFKSGVSAKKVVFLNYLSVDQQQPQCVYNCLIKNQLHSGCRAPNRCLAYDKTKSSFCETSTALKIKRVLPRKKLL